MQQQQQQQQQQQRRSRFSFAKQHEIPTGRVAVRGGGTPLDGKVCLIGRHPLRPGSTIAHAEIALEPTRNPPPPGFLRHLALIAGNGNEVLFVDVLDSYAAVANGFVRALQLPEALGAFGAVIAPGGEAWIGPASCVPSSLIPCHVLAAVVGGGVPTYTTTASAAPPGSALAPAPRGDAVFSPRYWRCELINWGARAPFEVACNASVHATEVEAVIFEMAGPAGDTRAANAPQQGSSRRGFGVRQYTYQHRPHDPPVRRAAAADEHVHTLKSPEEGLHAAAATMREMAADHFDFRDVTFTGPSRHRQGPLQATEVLESSQSTPSAGTSSTTPPLPRTPVTEHGGPDAAPPKREAALSHTLPQCAKVVLSDGSLRRCYLDPRRVVGVAVGDVIAVFQSHPRAKPAADQSNPGPVPATENGGSTVPGLSAAGGASPPSADGPPLPMGVGRVLQLTSWSRRRSVTQGGHLVAKRRATIDDLHADPAVAGITRVPAPSLPAEPAAADGAVPTVMYTALVGRPPTPAAFIEVDAKTFHQKHPAPPQDAPGASSHYPPLGVAGIDASAVHRIARQRPRGGSAAPPERQHPQNA